MSTPLKVCICGGGSLGHVIAGTAAHAGDDVRILTRRPDEWHTTLVIDDCRGSVFHGTPSLVTSDAAEALREADIALLCLPGFAIEEELQKMRPHLEPRTCVGSVVSSTGFFFAARRILGPEARLFGLQRAPFIARTAEYGRSAHLLGYKPMLHVATLGVPHPETLCGQLGALFRTPVTLLGHYLEASLTNSNPILHTARLYGLWADTDVTVPVNHIPGFYSDWDDRSSELLCACDDEFQRILAAIPARLTPIPRLLDYYESATPEALTRKIRSIAAFQGIAAPMKTVPGGYLPDFENRYFTEDFPYGLLIVKSVAEAVNCPTPTIDRVLEWGSRMMGREYLRDGRLCRADLAQSAYVTPELFAQLLQA